MKKVFIILGISLVIAACGGPKADKAAGSTDSVNNITAATSNSSAAQDTSVSKIGTGSPAASAASKGQTLMASLDCNTCHKEHEKVIGPALADIAKKYTSADVETLAKKVISGGSGNWGSVPMTAHPDLKLADAEEMVKYVLSVK